MGNNASEALKLAIGLVITMVLIAIVVVAFSFGRNQANNAISDMSKDTQAMRDSRVTQYDGLETTGAAVLDIINKFESDNIPICVNTSATTLAAASAMTANCGGTTYIMSGTGTGASRQDKTTQQQALRQAKTVGSATYINPSSNFYGYISYDANGAIEALNFQAIQ